MLNPAATLYKSLIIMILCTAFSQGNGKTVKLRIIDSESEQTVPARVLIKNSAAESFFPDSALTLKIASEEWFMSPGISVLDVSADTIRLRVERGKEYQRVKKVCDLSGKAYHEITVELKRWIHMKRKGYHSGENHLHLSAENAAVMCAAEDLDFGTSLQWWNRPRFGVPEGEGHMRRLSFASEQKRLTVYDVEVEEDWGALYLLNMPHPFPFLNDSHMPNLIAAHYGRQNGTLNCYQSGWSREVLIDALLGYVDVVNVCNNNFHMHRYQPRSHYSNLLHVAGLPLYPDTPQGMMQMNTDTYYRLLNCGLKLAAGAGSATGVKEVPAGYNRVYVQSPDNGLQEFLRAWKEGKNFATNGPMLFLTMDQSLSPGDSLHIKSPGQVHVYVNALSDMPLQTVDIIVNGTIVKSFNMQGQVQFTDSLTLNITQSCWIAARCTDRDTLLTDLELQAYKSPRVKLFQDPCRLRFAHTSPIYIYCNAKNIAVKKSLIEGLKIVGAFKEFALKNVAPKYKEQISIAADKADIILRKKLSSI